MQPFGLPGRTTMDAASSARRCHDGTSIRGSSRRPARQSGSCGARERSSVSWFSPCTSPGVPGNPICPSSAIDGHIRETIVLHLQCDGLGESARLALAIHDDSRILRDWGCGSSVLHVVGVHRDIDRAIQMTGPVVSSEPGVDENRFAAQQTPNLLSGDLGDKAGCMSVLDVCSGSGVGQQSCIVRKVIDKPGERGHDRQARELDKR